MTSPLLSATTIPDPTLLAGVAVLAAIGHRLVLIALFPYAPCRGCHGRGRSFHGQYWRPCRRCRGTGRTVRLGRRIWHWATSGDRT